MAPPIRGGQIWEQTRFPYCRRYVVYLGIVGGPFSDRLPRWLLIGDPTSGPGNIAARTTEDGPLYTTAELEARMDRYDYQLQGQLYDIIQGAAHKETEGT